MAPGGPLDESAFSVDALALRDGFSCPSMVFAVDDDTMDAMLATLPSRLADLPLYHQLLSAVIQCAPIGAISPCTEVWAHLLDCLPIDLQGQP